MDNENGRNEFGVRPMFYTGLGENHRPTPWTSGAISALSTSVTETQLDKVIFPHPVAEALSKRGKGADRVKQMRILAANDGIHAPLRLAMEERIMRRIQPRLPGLYSHHPLAAQLDGSLDDIDVTDFLNPPEDAEYVGMPHLLMEKKLGIL
ncbi:Proteasome maturation factor UMP1 domain-containing protein [Fasciola gigantica]|uniref:Proteasome maturation factor UMP1 domain-containing protein n=1 Tax=Fasciola gigantica TaxID=46835 RepID=A0A504YNH4_FASGI|nr:Proteasome maturation factor UMP1 domain-containing protein [Fasciola gigantica]